MNSEPRRTLPDPIVDNREKELLKSLTARYEKLVEPGPVERLGDMIAGALPEPVKDFGKSVGDVITEQQLYQEALKVIGTGFGAVQEQAARFSVSKESVVERVGSRVEGGIGSLDEVCLARAYDVSSIVGQRRTENLLASLVEGFATGVPGFAGIPFNLVLSMFLYFRAVQVVALTYGYDVRDDPAEMEIAGQVFAAAMDPTSKTGGNGAAALIGKIMMVSEASALRQTAAKTWADMAARGGVGLLLTQMRALANKFAQRALERAGKTGLENSVFRTVFEQIGRRLTLKTIQRAVPVVSGLIGAFFDTGQMQTVIDYADIFYAKRFILEKEVRVSLLDGDGAEEAEPEVMDDEADEVIEPLTPDVPDAAV